MHREGRGSVLLIDDSGVSRAVLSEWLTADGWTIFEAATGRGVVSRVSTFRPDVVISDLHMPDVDGYGVIEQLASAGIDVPVIIVSADQAVSAVLRAVREGAFDYVIKKPGDPEPLLAAVERASRHAMVLHENRRLTQELNQANRMLATRLEELKRQNRQRRMVEDALTLARDHALSASRAKSAFLTNMSHELRTPLNAMLGYAELMSETVDEPHVIADLGRIIFAGHHLLQLIDDVLDLAKVEAGHTDVEPTEVEVSTLIEAVEIQALPAIQQRGLRFVVDAGSHDLGSCCVDRRLLVQCLHQLIDNAVKFTQEGEVSLRVRRDDAFLIFEVSDTGCGISPRKQAEIFGAFTRGEPEHGVDHGGPGLGLTIALRLCDLMGGRLALASEVGRGSTFTVTLPHDARDKGDDPHEDSSREADVWPVARAVD